MSVTRGQYNARSTVTFPAARHHRPLAGTKLLLGDRGTGVLTTRPGLHLTAGGRDPNPQPTDRMFSVLTTRPMSHMITMAIQLN